mmetsp:Transcript_105754/g.227945  ORF Transcript_105754/g.227945 Transcript_105754/m.227945 type:complete len:217 (-) Transcript_105754:86-736(-)
MLRGDHHGVDLLRLHGAIRLLQVLNGDLRLAVRTQPPEQAALAHISEHLAQARGHGVSQGHAVLGLIAGIAEHDALVAGTHIHVVLANVHATRDVRALLVDAHKDLAGLVAEALGVHARQVIHVGVVADPGNGSTHDLVVVQLGLGRDLTRNHHHVVLRAGLAGDLALRVRGEAGIQHGIGDLVADLVRVALVHGLRGEKENALGLGLLLRRLTHC